jgi:hypothetical protein
MQILDTKWFDNPSLLLGNLEVFSLEMDRPLCSALASKALQSIQGKDLCYQRSNSKIWADWGSAKDKDLIDGLEQVKTYVKALTELPNLVLRHFRRTGINTGIGKVQEEIICRKFLLDYQIRSQWLDYYLLHNQSILKELKSSYKKHLEAISLVSHTNYKLIQIVWAKAEASQNVHFQWLLHFDSPIQIWFAIEAYICQIQMIREMTPGNKQAAESKETYRDKVVESCDQRLNALNRDIDFNIVGDEENIVLSLVDALEITALRMSKDSAVRGAYYHYLKAWRSEASYQRRCKFLQRSHLDSYGKQKNRGRM